MTTAQGLIEKFEARVDYFEHRIAGAKDSFERGILTGWRDATKEALYDLRAALPDIQAEAFFGEEEPQPFVGQAA